MAQRHWPRSLRSPLWAVTGSAVVGALAANGTVAFVAGAAVLALVRQWRLAACLLAAAWGAWNADRVAESGRPPAWRGTGCFVCDVEDAAEVHDWGWRVPARCRGRGTERWVRLEGRGAVPDCVGTLEVWATWVPWKASRDFDEVAIFGRRGWAGRLLTMADPVWLNAEDWNRGKMATAIQCMKSRLLSRFERHLPERTVAFLWGISTGDKGRLQREDRDAFAAAGLAHVLAVSGYHVGLVGFFPLLLARSKRQSLRLLGLMGIPLIGAYVLFCGASESAVRAWSMATLMLVASSIRRPGSLGHSLCFAAWAMLLFHPLAVRQLGTQLSFIAVLGIALGLEAAASWRWPRIGRLVAIPVAAQAATTPLTVPTFLRFPLGFLPANLLAGPVVTAVGFILMGWLVAPPSSAVGRGLSTSLKVLVEALLTGVEWGASWSCLQFIAQDGDVGRWWAIGVGTLAALLACFRSAKWWLLAGIAWASVPWWPVPEPARNAWVMERGRDPVLVIGDKRWSSSLPKDNKAQPTSAWRCIDGLCLWECQQGDSVQWVGLHRAGVWTFRCDARAGLGRFEVNGHTWIWERWHDRVSGPWPQ